MAYALYKVTITDHDYNYTTYTTWVSAMSRNQAIAKGACLAGGEKTRREWQRTGHDPHPEGLFDPEITLETVDSDEFYRHEDEVTVKDDSKPKEV